jgi:regulator of cell morphogenesis and NO signaling
MDPAQHLAQLVRSLGDEVVRRHHDAERHLLTSLRAQADAMAAAGIDAAAGVARARTAFDALAVQLVAHLDKEEHILFPAVDTLVQAAQTGTARPPLPFATLLHPIRVMEADHERVSRAMDDLNGLVRAVSPTPAFEAPWTAWRRDVERLADDLAAHVRLENELLFPRTLDLERALP